MPEGFVDCLAADNFGSLMRDEVSGNSDVSPNILLSKGENNDDSSFTPAQVAQPMGQATGDNVGR